MPTLQITLENHRAHIQAPTRQAGRKSGKETNNKRTAYPTTYTALLRDNKQ